MAQKRILVAPLDWGLGHATRCIPIIRELQKQGAEVILGAANMPLTLLRQEFPELEYVVFPGMNVAYPKKIPMSLFMAFKAPRFLKWVKEEEELVDSVVKSHNIDGIISDNRYGLHNTNVPSVLITHQLFIKASVLSFSLKNLTRSYASRFSYCWVPDFKGNPNLSGDLSHGKIALDNLRYVGPLSRFNANQIYREPKYDLLAVLSGPEPSRTVLEQTLFKQLKNSDLKALIVRGLVDAVDNKIEEWEGIRRVNYLNTKELEREILNAKMVLCRSGYSSIMDLATLGKKAFFIPTKGQTEQEYLAKRLKKEGLAFYSSRANLNIEKQYKFALNYPGLKIQQEKKQLEDAITEFTNLVEVQ